MEQLALSECSQQVKSILIKKNEEKITIYIPYRNKLIFVAKLYPSYTLLLGEHEVAKSHFLALDRDFVK